MKTKGRRSSDLQFSGPLGAFPVAITGKNRLVPAINEPYLAAGPAWASSPSFRVQGFSVDASVCRAGSSLPELCEPGPNCLVKPRIFWERGWVLGVHHGRATP